MKGGTPHNRYLFPMNPEGVFAEHRGVKFIKTGRGHDK